MLAHSQMVNIVMLFTIANKKFMSVEAVPLLIKPRAMIQWQLFVLDANEDMFFNVFILLSKLGICSNMKYNYIINIFLE